PWKVPTDPAVKLWMDGRSARPNNAYQMQKRVSHLSVHRRGCSQLDGGKPLRRKIQAEYPQSMQSMRCGHAVLDGSPARDFSRQGYMKGPRGTSLVNGEIAEVRTRPHLPDFAANRESHLH